MSNKFHYVYKLIDINTGQFYIGSRTCECTPEEDNYMGSPYVWEPIMENLSKEIVKQNFKSREEAIKYEADLIEVNINDELNENYHIPNKGYHNQGRRLSKEWRRKIGLANEGEKNCMYGLRGSLSPHYDIPKSEEHRKKISNAIKKYISIHGHWGKGIERSKETKKKIGEANSGKNNGMYGMSGNLSPTSKEVVCLQQNCCDNKVYNSITECAKCHNINRNVVSYNVNGKSKKQRFKLKKK